MSRANILAERRYLKEDFADDVISKAMAGDPSKPQPRQDLKGLTMDDMPNRKVVYAVEFVSEETFQAYYNAETWLKELGYTVGSMQRDNPIGFSNRYDRIAKWGNMTHEEHQMLDGIMISPDFREGMVVVLFFNSPNF